MVVFTCEFRRVVLGKPGEIQAYWDGANLNDPRYRRIDIASIPNYRERAIPLRVYGDGVPIDSHKKHSLDATNTSSILGEGRSVNTRILYSLCPERIKIKTGDAASQTEHVLASVLAWDLSRCANTGLHHTVDHAGNALPPGNRRKLAGLPICGDYRLVPIMMTSDLDYAANKWGLSHWGSRQPCSLCAGRFDDACNLFNFTMVNEWMTTLVTMDTWLARPGSFHPFFVTLNMTVFNYCPEIIHTLFLGTFLHISGSILSDMMDMVPGASHSLKCEAMWADIHNAYNILGIPHSERLPPLKPKMFKHLGDPIPCLHAKAAISKHFMRVLEHVLSMPKYTSLDHRHHHRCTVVGNANKFVDIVERSGYHVAPDQAQAGLRATMLCLTSYSYLARDAMDADKHAYHLTFKFHWWCHLAQVLEWYNPRTGWFLVTKTGLVESLP
jgi:hypothetical protein